MRAMSKSPHLPTVVLTGFLGSGKTTLLNRLLSDPAFCDAAVLVNEFGEIGIDHDLITQSTERVVVLAGGCVCCSIREDVEGALRNLFKRRDSGDLPMFNGLVIETSGLADPVPLLLTLRRSGVAASRLQLATVVTTVDAVLGVTTMARYREATRQIAAADVLVLTKSDLVSGDVLDGVRKALETLNPWAVVAAPNNSGPDIAALVCQATHRARNERLSLRTWVGRAFDSNTVAPIPIMRYRHLAEDTPTGACSFSIDFAQPVDWGAFGVWLTLVLHRHGERILRVKGILNVAGLRGPVAFHAAQHMVHPPEHLPEWPNDDQHSRIVFIVVGLEQATVLRSLKAFNELAARARDAKKPAAGKGAGGGGTIAGRPIRRPTAPSWIR
jgi:G3E family GTPase